MRLFDGITDSMDMSEQASEVGDGQDRLACCIPWGREELDITEQKLNWPHSHLLGLIDMS